MITRECFIIDENLLKENSNRDGFGSQAFSTFNFWKQVKDKDVKTLSKKQLEWLGNIEDYQRRVDEYDDDKWNDDDKWQYDN